VSQNFLQRRSEKPELEFSVAFQRPFSPPYQFSKLMKNKIKMKLPLLQMS